MISTDKDHASHYLRALTASAVDAIISADAEGRITSWNPAAERMFGYSAAEAVGQCLELILPKRFRAAHAAGIKRVSRGGPSGVLGATRELAALRKNGEEFPVELSLSSWESAGKRYFAGIIRDISERKQNEHELERFTQALRAKHAELRAKHAELQRTFSLLADLLEGHLIGGRYRVERKLRTQPRGVFYEATDLEQRGPVSIAVMRPSGASEPDQMRRRIGRARAALAAEHPALIEVLDVGVTRLGLPFVVLELLSGETLAELVQRRGTLSERLALQLAAQAASALASAHAAGISHGSLTLEEVFIEETREGRRLKLLGLGVSEFVARVTDEPVPGGGERADAYGLGEILRVLGYLAFAAIPPPGLSALSSALLSAEPHRRPTATTVVHELDAIYTAFSPGAPTS